MLMKLWPGYWKNRLEIINIKVDEENGKSVIMVNGQAQKVLWFLINDFF